MKELPNVTLIAYDNSDDPKKTIRALQHCASMIKFATVVLVCRIAQQAEGITFQLVQDKGYPAAMNFEVNEIHKYVYTDYALFISHDGYIVNPDRWKDSWFDFDFIGSPWPVQICSDNPKRRVGNTGFCLKSRAFMWHTSQVGHLFDPHTPGDVFCCRTMGGHLESLGIKFAPLQEAAQFGFETLIPEYQYGNPFGFHGSFNHQFHSL